MVLRIRGAPHDPKFLYALIFRLNRPYPKFPHAPDDPDGPVPLPDGAQDPVGIYALGTYKFGYPNQGVYSFDSLSNDRDNCFFG
ncbi:MAG: hypothetical protein LC685_02820, partial [Actinobacteria bacterium]|nr:hypothetical protein [Actinomycetota bacterium]